MHTTELQPILQWRIITIQHQQHCHSWFISCPCPSCPRGTGETWIRDESRVYNSPVIKIVTLIFHSFFNLPDQVKSLSAARNSYLQSDIPTHILLGCLCSIDLNGWVWNSNWLVMYGFQRGKLCLTCLSKWRTHFKTTLVLTLLMD